MEHSGLFCFSPASVLCKASDSVVEPEQLVTTFLLSFVGVAVLSFFARRQIMDRYSASDDEILERNATAYKITSGLFLGSLLVPASVYVFGVDENEAWPAVTALLLSLVLPIAYLSLRKLRGGPGFDEFLRYGELKDGWPRKWQIAVMCSWSVFVFSGVAAALLMN